ncbi:MAG: hypothetical protein HY850_07070 [Betaproteobacteria bacterium]|nr:hypothetical protein [Betaproteobacteria bacterium]
MLKLLIWLAIALAAVFWFRAARRKNSNPPPAKGEPEIESMVRCQVCGVNLPRSEAVMSQGRFYCCPEHREQDRG